MLKFCQEVSAAELNFLGMRKTFWAGLLLLASLGCASGGKSVAVRSGDVVERQAGLAQDVAGKLNAKKVFTTELDVAAATPKPKPVAAVVHAPQKQAGGTVELEKLVAPGRINIVAFEADW